MDTYVAFLRGIGPGDQRKSNESLRTVFSSLGFADVESFISSGNIIFKSEEADAAVLEDRIEQAFQKIHGLEVTTFVRTKQALAVFLARKHFGILEHSRQTYLLVTFLKKGALSKQIEAALLKNSGAFSIDRHCNTVCSVVDTTVQKTPDAMLKLEKLLGKQITSRTLNTIQRITARF